MNNTDISCTDRGLGGIIGFKHHDQGSVFFTVPDKYSDCFLFNLVYAACLAYLSLCKLRSVHYAFHPPRPRNIPCLIPRIISTQFITKHQQHKQQTYTRQLNKSPSYHSLNPFPSHHPLNKTTHPYSYWPTYFHHYNTAVTICMLLHLC
jgi:hypothetical protein